MNVQLALLLLLISFSALSFPITPNRSLSPGELCSRNNPDFKEYRYSERIAYCQRNVSYELREAVCERDGVENRQGYKVDHIVPLSIGGSNSAKNLWCQHLSIDTEELEFKLYEMVRDGDLSRDLAVERLLRCKFERICH
jgi:hypothetical protein